MIFLKVPVGMRKIATLTMDKTVRGGTISNYRLFLVDPLSHRPTVVIRREYAILRFLCKYDSGGYSWR